MRLYLLLAFIYLGQFSLVAQPPIIPVDSIKNDSFAFFNSVPTKCDFILIYSEESYWRSNTENFKLLTFYNNQWTALTYYRKWKSSSDIYDNKGQKKKKYFHKVGTVESVATKQLFDSLSTLKFWTLRKDSLNETRGVKIFDLVNYKFQIETLRGIKVVESYAPEYFLSEFPDMNARILFLKGKDMFGRWWKRYCR